MAETPWSADVYQTCTGQVRAWYGSLMRLSNTYADLPDTFFAASRPTTVADPRLFLWNADLAADLQIPDEDRSALAASFSGNALLPGSDPIALAYAGHQFGHFVPQLGDGRAHLLGEAVDRSGQLVDIQLKGSGRTPFSRGGDGRCAIGPAIREFIMSEAINALGVPTTRSLAVVTTGEPVFRDTPLKGAVVTRVAASHLRVGTFEYFSARGDRSAIEALSDFAIERHYPELAALGEDKYLALLDRVIERQIHLVVEWMRVGFIHGVMNTDNTAISGETIDYGPCAMMNAYDPATVFSSIDRQRRYAFGNQADIANWNMARFAECLLPLISADQDAAIDAVNPSIMGFRDRFTDAWQEMMGRKLGFTALEPADQEVMSTLVDAMKNQRLDYTLTFHKLGEALTSTAAAEEMKAELNDAFDQWRRRVDDLPAVISETQAIMRQHNPVVIPRNHDVEAVLRACAETGEADAAERFLDVLRSPYEASDQTAQYQAPPPNGDQGYKTFCGT